MIAWIASLPWALLVFACLTLGLAPFTPPHIFEKIGMLRAGTLTKPIDQFDLVFHAAPFLLLAAKVVVTMAGLAG